MPIFTPRGLKIRLRNAYCFALMKRLFHDKTPFQLLKTTEGFECLKDIYVLIGIMIVLILNQNFIVLGVTVFLLIVIEGIFEKFFWVGTLRNPLSKLLLKLSELFSYINGFLIYTIGICITLFLVYKWKGILAYLIALAGSELLLTLVTWFIEPFIKSLENQNYVKKLGTTLTKSERDFLNSYIFHSETKEPPLDIDNTELEKNNWQDVYRNLSVNWPTLVDRITPDEEDIFKAFKKKFSGEIS